MYSTYPDRCRRACSVSEGCNVSCFARKDFREHRYDVPSAGDAQMNKIVDGSVDHASDHLLTGGENPLRTFSQQRPMRTNMEGRKEVCHAREHVMRSEPHGQWPTVGPMYQSCRTTSATSNPTQHRLLALIWDEPWERLQHHQMPCCLSFRDHEQHSSYASECSCWGVGERRRNILRPYSQQGLSGRICHVVWACLTVANTRAQADFWYLCHSSWYHAYPAKSA